MLSQVDYATIGCPAYGGDCLLFTFPTRDGPTVCLATDTSYFDYDAAGNLRRADNGWAWVRRAYTPSGLVSHDTLVVRTYETSAPYPCGPGDRHSGGVAAYTADFTTHVYALRMTYDLEGRRDSLFHPDGIDFCTGTCVTRYSYEAATGLLSTVTDPLGYGTSFAYDAAGRDTATTYPGTYLHPVVMRRGYDPDGNVVTRSGPFTTGDALTRDAQGRLVSGAVGDIAGNGPAGIRLVYGALGAVVYTENLTQGATYEEDSVDALGNRLWQHAYGMNDEYIDRHRRLFLDDAGRLDSIRLVPPLPPGLLDSSLLTRAHIALYDAAGNSHQSYGWPNPHRAEGGLWDGQLDEAVSYFDAEDRLRIFNRHTGLGPVSDRGGLYEEYRYDALGRRVLVRSRCTASQASDAYCRGSVERTVWDGAQVLYELRAPGHDSAWAWDLENDTYYGTNPYGYDLLLGRVGYVHAGGIDAPLAVYRMGLASQPGAVGVAPHANFQGDFEIGSLIGGSYGGQSTRGCQGLSGCPIINWPGGTTTIDGELPNPNPIQTWFGNLLQQRTDGSGLQYLRNRYYDARTGRFTQSDPIGLAGGLNLYGFASGDPVNFSDPFGLCPPRLTGRPCLLPVPGGGGIRTSVDNPQIGRFGMVRNDGTRAHQGIDILGPLGNGVVAADDGVVTWAGPREGYGNVVEIEHRSGQGEVVSFTAYAHLDEVNVKKGQSLAAGKPLGSIGSSGNARGTDPHLHFEIRTRSLPPKGLDGRLNPLPWNRQ